MPTAAKTATSLEMRRWLTQLLEQAPPHAAGEALRQSRAVDALELIGTPEARKLLAQLATGAAAVRQTREARLALARLEKRRTDR